MLALLTLLLWIVLFDAMIPAGMIKTKAAPAAKALSVFVLLES